MKGQFTHILNTLKKWLSRLTCHSVHLFFLFLSSLRRAAGHLKLGASDKRFITRFLGRALPLPSRRDIAGEDSPICSSVLPPGEMRLEVAGNPPSLSDDPYSVPYLRPLQMGTVMPPLEINTTMTGYPSATETDGLHQDSMSSLHLSLQRGESSGNNRTFLEDPLQEPSSPSPSRLSSLHEVSTAHSRPRGYMDDAHSIHSTRTPSMRHLTPDMPYSQYASEVGKLHIKYTRDLSILAHCYPIGSARPGGAVTDVSIDHHYIASPVGAEQPGSVLAVYNGASIAGMMPVDSRRNVIVYPRNPNVYELTIPGMTTTFPTHDMAVPQGWTTFVHPEGPRYFVNQETRIFTEMNICDEETCADVEYYMQHLLDALQQAVENGNLTLDVRQVDLVVEPKIYDDNTVVGCYCFVNHRDRCLFWLDSFNPKDVISDCKGVESLSHIRLAIQAEYWRCLHYFPNLYPVTQNLIDELKDMLIHATCDHLTSDQSSAAFNAVELRDHLSVVDRMKGKLLLYLDFHALISLPKAYPPADQGMQRCHTTIVISRIMYAFSRNHFLNYYGEKCVRLHADQTVHGWEYKLSPLMVILAPLLFLDSVAQVYELNRVFVDEIACTARWNSFTSKFNGQLQDSNLLATVLLNANVGFLAINSVDKGGRSAIQMASYMSLVTSMGSMVVGLLLVSHNRSKSQDTPFRTTMFLSGLHDRKHGLEKLGIIYSLPKALLIWGMVFFFAAFSINWWSPGDEVSKVVVGTVVLVVFITILCSIAITGESGWTSPLHGRILLSRLAGALKQWMEFVGVGIQDLARDPQFYSEGIGLTPVGLSQSYAEADVPIQGTSSPSTISPGFQPEILGLGDHDNQPNSSIPPIRLHHASVSVDSPQQPHDGNSVLPSSNSSTSAGVLSGAGSLQQNQEDIQTVFQDQSTMEARCDHDSAPLGVHLNASPSERMVGTAANVTLQSDALPTTVTILSEHSRPQEDDHQAGH
ncbi:hypothetical protein EDB19DRAFT_2040001 [Suillus lakei]|nr:hypothetical protein EDB19DRAFT_2040001 [Suillus lakei]